MNFFLTRCILLTVVAPFNDFGILFFPHRQLHAVTIAYLNAILITDADYIVAAPVN